MTRLSRRALLRAGGGSLAVALGAAAAGCSAFGVDRSGTRTTYGVPPRTDASGRSTPSPTGTTAGESTATRTAVEDSDQVVDFQALSVPDPAGPAYRQWLPEPSRVFPGRRGYAGSLRYARPFWLDQFGPDLPAGYDRHRSIAKVGLDYFGIGFERYVWVLRVGGRTAVVVAPFDRSAVADTLRGTGYGRVGTHGGVALFAREDGPRAVGLGDGTLVWSADPPGNRSPVEAVRTIYDAKAGTIPRYHDADRGFATLTTTVGGPLVGKLFAGASDYPVAGWEFDDLDGWGWAGAFDREHTYLRTVFAFDRPKNRERLARRIRNDAADREFYRSADAVDVTATDRAATLVAAVADERYPDLFGTPRTEVTYPQVTWGYEHDPGAEEVTITHRGGDEVPADTLHVDNFAVPDERQFADEYDAVGPGDALTVATSPTGRGTIHVRWRSPAGNVMAVVGRYDVPDGS